jgi:hypothetical protein
VRVDDEATLGYKQDLARLSACPGLALMLPRAELADGIAALRLSGVPVRAARCWC